MPMPEDLPLRIDPAGVVIEQLVDQVIALSAESQARFAETYAAHAWQADLREPAKFTFDTDPVTVFEPQFLGTTADASNSWLWGWENVNGFPESVLQCAERVRGVGEHFEVPELTTAIQPLDAGQRRAAGLNAANAAQQTLVYAAMALAGYPAPVFYRGPVGQGSYAWFLLDNPDAFSLPAPTTLATAEAFTAAIDSGHLHDHRLVVQGYADRREGVELSEDGPDALLAVSDGVVRIVFDDQGRMSQISGEVG